ncbi:MAG: Hpt domain-containing protein [Lachnospiraceae bacterium]
MTVKEMYDSIGADYYDVLDRFMREDLVEHFALNFLQDRTYKELEKAIMAKDVEASFRAAHNLKGVAGNLGFSELFRVSSDLTEQLRPKPAEVDICLFQKVREQYAIVVAALTSYDFGDER